MSNQQRRDRWKNWMQNIYQLGTLASLVFIMAQAYYARRSILQSSEWEKAKLTIENIEQFKESMNISPLSNSEIWVLGNGLWADASTPEGWQLTDTLRSVYSSLFDNNVEAMDELFRLIEVMDAFAYPIIMGYASDMGSYQSAIRQYSTFGNFILPFAFHMTPNIGLYAKLLYRLWRIRTEIMEIDSSIKIGDNAYNYLRNRIDHLLCYEGADISEASLKEYRKKLEKKLKEVQKEIEVFRKNSLR